MASNSDTEVKPLSADDRFDASALESLNNDTLHHITMD